VFTLSTRSTYTGALHCARQTVAREGAGALFKGMLPPLVTSPFINAITFAAYARGKEVGDADALRSHVFVCYIHVVGGDVL
jgi:Mitochondrial carrier protein